MTHQNRSRIIAYLTKPKFYIRCNICNTRIFLAKPDSSHKRHGVCNDCHLEWHYLPDGKVYAHPLKG